jgi:hypothetical protein
MTPLGRLVTHDEPVRSASSARTKNLRLSRGSLLAIAASGEDTP